VLPFLRKVEPGVHLKTGTGSRRIRARDFTTLSISLLAASLLLATPVKAASAFAAGIPDDIGKDGVAVGAGFNYDNRALAEQNAMDQCHKQMSATAEVRGLCKIVDHFDHRCLVVAMDPKDGTPGFGWAIADTSDSAHDQALNFCHQTAGNDRAPYCVVSFTDCDTKP